MPPKVSTIQSLHESEWTSHQRHATAIDPFPQYQSRCPLQRVYLLHCRCGRDPLARCEHSRNLVGFAPDIFEAPSSAPADVLQYFAITSHSKTFTSCIALNMSKELRRIAQVFSQASKVESDSRQRFHIRCDRDTYYLQYYKKILV